MTTWKLSILTVRNSTHSEKWEPAVQPVLLPTFLAASAWPKTAIGCGCKKFSVNATSAQIPSADDKLNWWQQTKLVAGDGLIEEIFGTAVATNGSEVLVSAARKANQRAFLWCGISQRPRRTVSPLGLRACTLSVDVLNEP